MYNGVHVADASNPAVFDQISAVYSVLEELGIEEKDTLLVANKVDALEDRGTLDALLARYPNALPVSAHSGEGLDAFALAVADALSSSFANVDIDMSVSNGRLMAYLAAQGEVLSKRYHEDRVIIHCRLPQAALGRITEKDIQITPHSKPVSQSNVAAVDTAEDVA